MERDDDVWLVKDLEGQHGEVCYVDKRKAQRFAEQIVGNRAVADTGEILLYGRGDGSTRLMVRRWPREWALKGDTPIIP